MKVVIVEDELAASENLAYMLNNLQDKLEAVSYTHLTLPTIYSV